MDMGINITFSGPVYDPSGYGECARWFIAALHQAGVSVRVEPVCIDRTQPDLGAIGPLCRSLETKRHRTDVKIINLTPEHFSRLTEPDCVNIGYTMFETTRIPDLWVDACNRMQGILVPCRWNREVFQRSGVRVPVRVAAPGVEIPARQREKSPPLSLGRCCKELVPRAWIGHIRRKVCWLRRKLQGEQLAAKPLGDKLSRFRDHFKFYSIFQWTERKNPQGLLKAYFAEFRDDCDVCLLLKTYRSNFGFWERREIRRIIAEIQESMRLKRYPPVLLIDQALSRDDMRALHRLGDCFVLPHRAEGYGMPHLEAMAFGKPVITTGFSGNMDFTMPEHAFLLPYQLTPVCGMPWIRWYEGDMLWAEPDLDAPRKIMRYVYEHREEAAEKGEAGREFVRTHFNAETCARNLLAALEEITASPAVASHTLTSR